jgi:hypothetical protein
MRFQEIDESLPKKEFDCNETAPALYQCDVPAGTARAPAGALFGYGMPYRSVLMNLSIKGTVARKLKLLVSLYKWPGKKCW